MSKVSTVTRIEPLAGKVFASNGVLLSHMPPATRLSLRLGEAGQATAKKALGFALPQAPKSSASKGETHCLWIGPDEWLVISQDNPSLIDKFAKLGNSKLSAVDISHRNTGVLVVGGKAADTLNSGCPQDLSLEAFPVGAATRTILGKAEIVLYRISEKKFRVECWRSFSNYVWTFLVEAVKSA